MALIKKLFVTMAITISSLSASAETYIPLVQPSKAGGLTIMEALWNRHSSREFSKKKLSDQDISDLLFAASGINRIEENKITSPSALNTQEIDLYMFTHDGVYKYIPNGHRLQKVAEEDCRSLIAGTPQFSQDFVIDAPVSLLTVANPQKFDGSPEIANMMAVADAGIMSENICLFCAGRGLSTVPRATMNREGISKLLNLPKEAILVLNMPVGYPK